MCDKADRAVLWNRKFLYLNRAKYTCIPHSTTRPVQANAYYTWRYISGSYISQEILHLTYQLILTNFINERCPRALRCNFFSTAPFKQIRNLQIQTIDLRGDTNYRNFARKNSRSIIHTLLLLLLIVLPL